MGSGTQDRRPRAAAFLRAVNVGGRTVTMERLRELLAGQGLGRIETVLASGNLLFDLPPEGAATVERRIESRLRKELGYEVATFVRTAAEIEAIAHREPFGGAAAGEVHGVYVAFLPAEPDGESRRAVESASTADDLLRVVGREVYWLCRTRFSDSPLSGPKLEKLLGQPATVRNLTTVRKVATRLA